MEFGKIEVRAGPAIDQLFGVVEEEEAKVEEAGGHRRTVDEHVFFDEVPSARAHQKRGHRLVELVIFPTLFVDEGDVAAHGIAKVDLALDNVGPGRRVGVLEVGHKHVGARVQRIDDHLPLDGAGDLDAAIEQVGGKRCYRPIAGANLGGLV